LAIRFFGDRCGHHHEEASKKALLCVKCVGKQEWMGRQSGKTKGWSSCISKRRKEKEENTVYTENVDDNVHRVGLSPL